MPDLNSETKLSSSMSLVRLYPASRRSAMLGPERLLPKNPANIDSLLYMIIKHAIFKKNQFYIQFLVTNQKAAHYQTGLTQSIDVLRMKVGSFAYLLSNFCIHLVKTSEGITRNYFPF